MNFALHKLSPTIFQIMSNLFNLAALLLLTVLCTPLFAQTADEKAIYAVLEEGSAAFEARDADRFAAIFTEKADFIPPVGHLIHGREAIRQGHIELFKNFPKPSGTATNEYVDRQIRMLTPDLALLTVQDKVTDKNGDQVFSQKTSISALLRRSEGKWLAELVTLTPLTVPERGPKN